MEIMLNILSCRAKDRFTTQGASYALSKMAVVGSRV